MYNKIKTSLDKIFEKYNKFKIFGNNTTESKLHAR
jgi:hypothetical protein